MRSQVFALLLEPGDLVLQILQKPISVLGRQPDGLADFPVVLLQFGELDAVQFDLGSGEVALQLQFLLVCLLLGRNQVLQLCLQGVLLVQVAIKSFLCLAQLFVQLFQLRLLYACRLEVFLLCELSLLPFYPRNLLFYFFALLLQLGDLSADAALFVLSFFDFFLFGLVLSLEILEQPGTEQKGVKSSFPKFKVVLKSILLIFDVLD